MNTKKILAIWLLMAIVLAALSMIAIFFLRGWGHLLSIVMCVLMHRVFEQQLSIHPKVGSIAFHACWFLPLLVFLYLVALDIQPERQSIFEIVSGAVWPSALDRILLEYQAFGPISKRLPQYESAYTSLYLAAVVGAITYSLALPIVSATKFFWSERLPAHRDDLNMAKFRTSGIVIALIPLALFWWSPFMMTFGSSTKYLGNPIIFVTGVWFGWQLR